MKIVSWNCNSIRQREERLLNWLRNNSPDVMCLQELKAEEKVFPREVIQGLGYSVAAVFQKTYNGVAILAKTPITDVVSRFDDGGDESQARFISAVVDGVRIINVYCPNGGELGSDKWTYKLDWLGRLRRYLDKTHRKDEPLILLGDFNVAPEDRDVHDPAAWQESVLFHVDARTALKHIMDFGLVDTLRIHTEAPGILSWWDYRMLAFPKGHGLRIDLILATDVMAKRCTAASVDRQERKGKQASDHAPAIADFASAG